MKSQIPEPALGELIQTLVKRDLRDDAQLWEPEAIITDCKTVASFNWLDSREPRIIVPGQPPRWTPLDEPRQLPEDSGEFFRDQNAARFPRHPLEPAVLAAAAMAAEALGDLDIVTCGSTLGNLLRFVRGESKTFRILVELVDNTVFLTRRENAPDETIPHVKGFGHTFPDAYTTWDPAVRGSASHQRLLRYRFGGLDLLVRFEADGSLAGRGRHTGGPGAASDAASLDDIVKGLAANAVSPATPTASTASTALKITRGGQLSDPASIFDLKTRSMYWKDKVDTLATELPRCWIAQIPNFILAYHQRGLFPPEEITVRDVRADIRGWEQDNKETLGYLAALLRRIIDLVQAHPEGKLELRHVTAGLLELREQLPSAGQAFSSDGLQTWRACQRARSELSGHSDGASSGSGGGVDELSWTEESEDFTACSAACGYCGHCTY